MIKNIGLGVLFFLFTSTTVLAAASGAAKANVQIKVENAVAINSFSLAVGSEVTLQSGDSKMTGSAIFLGLATMPNGAASYYLFLNKREEKVLYVKAEDVVKKMVPQTVLNPYEQAGGTCTGYAIFEFLFQTHLSGFSGSGSLAKKVSDEKGRTTLLVDNINEYYLTPVHQYSIQGILNKYGRDFGFTCRTFKNETYEKLKGRILGQTQIGRPALISFNIGPDMVDSPFPLAVYNSSAELDQRLWIPRKVGERNSGGHVIVAAASFELNHKTYLVVLDSDWEEPRVWDMDAFMNAPKTATAEIEITTCK